MTTEPPQRQPPTSRLANPGGTSGGAAEFVIGLLLMGIGAWMFVDRVMVWGGRVPAAGPLAGVVVGVALLFFDGRSKLGWLAIAAGIGWMLVSVFMASNVYFRPTSLKTTLLMLGLIGAGLGLVGRAVKAH